MKKKQASSIKGLTSKEVELKISAGLSNQSIDSISISYKRIFFRNIFNLINIFLFPLLTLLLALQSYKDAFVIGAFGLVNSLVSMWDEMRIKRRLEKININFINKVRVIRDGKEQFILCDEVVIDDVVKILEGENFPTDGIILESYYLQIDESIITGEANYVSKEKGEKVFGGSFVVSGECLYKVNVVGSQNFINSLSSQTKQYQKKKGMIQKYGDKLTVFFVVAAIIFGLLSVLISFGNGLESREALRPLVSSISLIIPQTLIFLYTFTFSVSVLKLSRKGALVQRGSSIETLANLDVICFDKTGTITTNKMKVVDVKYWNIREEQIGKIYKYLEDKVYGKNKTFFSIINYFNKSKSIDAINFDQDPFTSKTKMAKNFLETDSNILFHYGALSSVRKYFDLSVLTKLEKYVSKEESKGNRIIVGAMYHGENLSLQDDFKTKQAWVISIQEEVNTGISRVLENILKQKTQIKIITGDSAVSVQRILHRVKFDDVKIVDLSKQKIDSDDIAMNFDVFARTSPEDKLKLVNILQNKGLSVGMVGDGINDILALKASDLSFSVGSGTKAAKDVSDIVLLKDDFALVPLIQNEADNIIANLKFMNIIFVSKTFFAIFFIIFCSILGLTLPIYPTSLLVYGFLAVSLPSYVIAFSRRKYKNNGNFQKGIISISLIFGVVSALVSMIIFLAYRLYNPDYINSLIIYGTLFNSLMFTMYLLWKMRYISKMYKLIFIYITIIFISIIPTFIGIIGYYYDVVPIEIVDWIKIFLIAFLGFIIYYIVQKIYTSTQIVHSIKSK